MNDDVLANKRDADLVRLARIQVTSTLADGEIGRILDSRLPIHSTAAAILHRERLRLILEQAIHHREREIQGKRVDDQLRGKWGRCGTGCRCRRGARCSCARWVGAPCWGSPSRGRKHAAGCDSTRARCRIGCLAGRSRAAGCLSGRGGRCLTSSRRAAQQSAEQREEGRPQQDGEQRRGQERPSRSAR